MKVLLCSLVLAFGGNAFAETHMTTQLDDLIRGEMAAVKVYDQVLKDVTEKTERTKLEAIRADHRNAVTVLKGYASADVKEDTQTVGPWGTFAKAYTGGAKLVGNETALKALKTGEEHGIKEYEEALEDDAIKADLKQKIRTQFLPKQKEHIKTLNSYI